MPSTSSRSAPSLSACPTRRAPHAKAKSGGAPAAGAAGPHVLPGPAAVHGDAGADRGLMIAASGKMRRQSSGRGDSEPSVVELDSTCASRGFGGLGFKGGPRLFVGA